MTSPEVKRKKSEDDDDDVESGDAAGCAQRRRQQQQPSSESNATHKANRNNASTSAPTSTARTTSLVDAHEEAKFKHIKGNHDVNGDSSDDANSSSVTEKSFLSSLCREKDADLKNGNDEANQDADVVDSSASSTTSTTTSPSPSPSSAGATTVLRETYGYEFDSEGRLKNSKTGEPFQFDVFGERKRNQKRYEDIGELITLKVYDLLESVGLRRVTIPVDAKEDEPTGFVFASPDLQSNADLLVLINGSGVVRAGQWARRLIINDCLDSGTQLPFIRQAQSRGFAVLVLNTNQTKGRVPTPKAGHGVDDASGVVNDGGVDDDNPDVSDEGGGVPKDWAVEEEKLCRIRGSRTAQEHGCYVFQKILMERKNLERIFVVAHSFGGVVTLDIAAEFPSYWRSKVKAVAFTDSVHGEQMFFRNSPLARWFANNAVNWVTSDKDVDTPLLLSSTVPCVSAGHTNHESTSWSAFNSIFQFFDEKLDESKN